MDRQRIERSIKGLSEWQMHVQAESDIDANISTAIEALKAQLFREGTTKGATSDLISRTATIDAVNNAFDRETLLTGFVRSIAVRTIRDMPPAQPEPKEGHWIDKGWNGDWAWQIDGRGNCWRVIECSECGKGVLVESNYCPHCGARMKGAEHEID